MSKHTPGPWGLTSEGDVRSSHTEENGYVSEYIASLALANYRFERMDERAPNAYLIAAAPGLLEALKSALAVGQIVGGSKDVARAAIAKAEVSA